MQHQQPMLVPQLRDGSIFRSLLWKSSLFIRRRMLRMSNLNVLGWFLLAKSNLPSNAWVRGSSVLQILSVVEAWAHAPLSSVWTVRVRVQVVLNGLLTACRCFLKMDHHCMHMKVMWTDMGRSVDGLLRWVLQLQVLCASAVVRNVGDSSYDCDTTIVVWRASCACASVDDRSQIAGRLDF